MSLAEEYRRQYAWRSWKQIFDALPQVKGQTVLDLGCGVGDQVAELVARGARVIGVDVSVELLHAAQARGLTNAEFRHADLRDLPDQGVTVDGIWCSFAAAYFPELPAVLATWGKQLRPGGWIALTEIDDLFGHEPLDARTKALLDAYAQIGFAAGRYDFQMGRKLRDHLTQSGFVVARELTLADRELSFDRPAPPEVIVAWKTRLDRMKLLRDFCGAEYENVRDEFLNCLTRADHHSTAKVVCCIAMK